MTPYDEMTMRQAMKIIRERYFMNEQDKKLLVDAAQSVGIELYTPSGYRAIGTENWNPLKNDADAFRLMVETGLSVLIVDGNVVCSRYYGEDGSGYSHSLNPNPSESVRRAITTAAAEIWRMRSDQA